MRGHEVDRFGSDFLSGNREIALIFPILVIYDDQDLALPELFDRFRYRSKGHSYFGSR